jgi:hypothetical protein
MPVLATDEVLRLHTDKNGFVWCGQHDVLAIDTGMYPKNFVTRPVLRDASHVRVLGVPENAALIAGIHELRTVNGGRPAKVQIGSPAICFCDNEDPAAVLQQMWQPLSAGSYGCWHELTEKDYPTYYLLTTLQAEGVGDLAYRILQKHPAWPALSFPATCDLESACKLVCEIVDPRWYNHADRPNRSSRLFSYLGLTAQANRRGRQRAELVEYAWAGGGGPADLDDPRNFLWRIHAKKGGDVRGVLEASRDYVQFLRWVWLQGLAAHGREVFVPSIFFKQLDEIAAYEGHVGQLQKRV